MKKIFVLFAPFIMLFAIATPAWAHSAMLKVACQEGTITWNLNPDTPSEGPVKVTSIDGPAVQGLAVGDTVPDDGVTFTSKKGGTLTVGLEWKKDKFDAKASNTFDGKCESTTTTTAPPTTTTTAPPTTTTTAPATTTTTAPKTTTTTLVPCVVNCSPPCQSSNQPGCGPTTTLPPTTTTKPPATTTTLAPAPAPVVVPPSVGPATLPHTGSTSTMVLGTLGTVLMLGGFLLVWFNRDSLKTAK